MIVCIVLICFFLLSVLQESGNLDAIFIVGRKKEEEIISKLVLVPTPFLVKSNFFNFF